MVAEQQEINIKKKKGPRMHYLDAWRVLCVVCVLITHADEIYAYWNIAAVQQWVLQLILVISGTCFSMSKARASHLKHYVIRLLVIIVFGTAVNAFGLLVRGDNPLDPLGKFADKVMFQMSFLMIIVGAAVVGSPLKYVLDDIETAWITPVMCAYSSIGILFAGCWLYFVEVLEQESADVLFRCGAMSMTMLLIAVIGVRFLPNSRRGWLGWILLAWIYFTQVIAQNPKVGYWWHLSDIYIWSMFVYRIPLAHDEVVGLFFARGWMLWSVAGALLGRMPGRGGRWDKYPFPEAIDRAMYYPLELLFMIAFVTVPRLGPERSLPLPQVLIPHLSWLNWWSLLAFCTHKGVYYAMPSIPWGLMLVLLSPIPFYVVWAFCQHRRRRRRRRRRLSAGEAMPETAEQEERFEGFDSFEDEESDPESNGIEKGEQHSQPKEENGREASIIGNSFTENDPDAPHGNGNGKQEVPAESWKNGGDHV